MAEDTGTSLTAFHGPASERLDAEQLVDAVKRLLDAYPQAPVLAMREDGIITPMPAGVRLRENPVLEGRAGLDLIEFDDEAMAGWEQILERGAAVYRVRPVGRPEVSWTIFGLDLREEHGIIFMLCAAQGAEDAGAPTGSVTLADFTSRAPRCATVHKDALAIIRFADAATLQMLGCEEVDIVGQRSTEFIHPDDQDLARDAWMQMLAQPGPGRRARLRHRRHDGTWLWFEVTNHNLLSDPAYGCVVCEMVDISEEMAAHELLNRLAETVPVGLLQLDHGGEVVYANDRLHEILGVARCETLDAQLASLRPEHRALVREAFARAVGEKAPADFEVQLTHPQSGEERYCTVGLRSLDAGTDAPAGAIVCVADITDSICMREELRRLSMYDELTGCLTGGRSCARCRSRSAGRASKEPARCCSSTSTASSRSTTSTGMRPATSSCGRSRGACTALCAPATRSGAWAATSS